MYYILAGHEPRQVDSDTWSQWFQTADRTVAKDVVGEKRVSTVFLGIDHNFLFHGHPELFETMVFPLDSFEDELCERYATWDEAVEGHRQIIAELAANG